MEMGGMGMGSAAMMHGEAGMGFGSAAKELIEGLIGLIVVFEVFHFMNGTNSKGGSGGSGGMAGIFGFIGNLLAYPGAIFLGVVLFYAMRFSMFREFMYNVTIAYPYRTLRNFGSSLEGQFILQPLDEAIESSTAQKNLRSRAEKYADLLDTDGGNNIWQKGEPPKWISISTQTKSVDELLTKTPPTDIGELASYKEEIGKVYDKMPQEYRRTILRENFISGFGAGDDITRFPPATKTEILNNYSEGLKKMAGVQQKSKKAIFELYKVAMEGADPSIFTKGPPQQALKNFKAWYQGMDENTKKLPQFTKLFEALDQDKALEALCNSDEDFVNATITAQADNYGRRSIQQKLAYAQLGSAMDEMGKDDADLGKALVSCGPDVIRAIRETPMMLKNKERVAFRLQGKNLSLRQRRPISLPEAAFKSNSYKRFARRYPSEAKKIQQMASKQLKQAFAYMSIIKNSAYSRVLDSLGVSDTKDATSSVDALLDNHNADKEMEKASQEAGEAARKAFQELKI